MLEFEPQHPYLRGWLQTLQGFVPSRTSWQLMNALAYWKSIDSERVPFENKWTDTTYRVLSHAGDVVGRAYASRGLSGALSEVPDHVTEPMREVVSDLLYQVEKHFGRRAGQMFRAKAAAPDPLAVWDPYNSQAARDWNANRTAEHVRNISSSTQDAIRRIVHQSLESGADPATIARGLSTAFAFSRERSLRIVQTEVAAASNAGSRFAVAQHMDTSRLHKVWLATGDRRVRRTHQSANGQEQKFNTPYTVGGSKLMFPGDHSLNANGKETIRCRCTEYYIPVASTRPQPTPPQPTPTPPRPPTLPRPPQPPPQPVVVQPPAAVTADSLHAELLARREAITTNVAALEAEARQVAVDLSVLQRAGQPIEDAIARSHMFSDQLQALQRQQASLIRDVLGNGTQMQLDVSISGTGVTGPIRRQLEENINELRAIVGDTGRQHRIKVSVDTGLRRAYFDDATNTIHLTPTDARYQPYVVYHEFGHYLENNFPAIKAAANSHWAKRTVGDTWESLAALTGHKNYGSEMTKKDKFLHPYMGKTYTSRDTELTSSMFEHFTRPSGKYLTHEADVFKELFNAVLGVRRP